MIFKENVSRIMYPKIYHKEQEMEKIYFVIKLITS